MSYGRFLIMGHAGLISSTAGAYCVKRSIGLEGFQRVFRVSGVSGVWGGSQRTLNHNIKGPII